MDTYLLRLTGEQVVTLAHCTVESTKNYNLPVVNLPWDCDKDHRQIRAAWQLRSTFITLWWGLWLTSGLPYASPLTPAGLTRSLDPCAGDRMGCGEVWSPNCHCASISVYSLIWWTSKKNNRVYFWIERNVFLCIKKLCFHSTQKNFAWKKKYFLKDAPDIINTNENERLILHCNHKTELEWGVLILLVLSTPSVWRSRIQLKDAGNPG